MGLSSIVQSRRINAPYSDHALRADAQIGNEILCFCTTSRRSLRYSDDTAGHALVVHPSPATPGSSRPQSNFRRPKREGRVEVRVQADGPSLAR
jgi:hypothetical protein